MGFESVSDHHMLKATFMSDSAKINITNHVVYYIGTKTTSITSLQENLTITCNKHMLCS